MAAHLAASQHGLITYQQALAVGLSPAAVRTRADTGRWQRVARGVVDDALHRRLVDTDQITACWDTARRAPGRAGEVRLREVLEPWAGPIRPGSPAEVRLRRQVVASAEFHGPTRWRHDEERHRAIEREGWVLLRADKLDLQPGAARLRTALGNAWRARRAA